MRTIGLFALGMTACSSLPLGNLVKVNSSNGTSASASKPEDASCAEFATKEEIPRWIAKGKQRDAQIAEALAKPSIYEKLHALLVLRDGDKPYDMPGEPPGYGFRLETEIAKLLTTPDSQAWWFSEAAQEPRTRRPLLDSNIEARGYCLNKCDGQTFPSCGYTRDELQGAWAKIKSSKQVFSPKKPDGMNTQGLHNFGFKAPVVAPGTMKVTLIATDSTTGITTIEAEMSNVEGWVASCRQTKERMVVENGKLQYDKNCIAGNTLQTTTIKMNTAALPPVGVQKDDEIRFWASVQTIDAATISSSKTKVVKKQHHSADSALIVMIKRGERIIFNISDIHPRT